MLMLLYQTYAYIARWAVFSSGDASDSIYPKGWGMAKWNEDGSYRKLIAITYGLNKNSIIRNTYNELNVGIRIDELIFLYPFSFLRLGSYSDSGGRVDREDHSRYITMRAYNGFNVGNLYISSLTINMQNSVDKMNGNSVRCVAKSYYFFR